MDVTRRNCSPWPHRIKRAGPFEPQYPGFHQFQNPVLGLPLPVHHRQKAREAFLAVSAGLQASNLFGSDKRYDLSSRANCPGWPDLSFKPRVATAQKELLYVLGTDMNVSVKIPTGTLKLAMILLTPTMVCHHSESKTLTGARKKLYIPIPAFYSSDHWKNLEILILHIPRQQNQSLSS